MNNKGYHGARSRVYRVAFRAVIKAGQYAYRDRRQRKRQVPSTVDCAYQRSSTSERYFYSKFINGLKKPC
ncbi:50S ribosomal protein L20 [Salmonella enterica subsp. enterica]|nr:50S ribosomal protein L20 [Salmonella enterica subsp. enterica]